MLTVFMCSGTDGGACVWV